MKNVDSVGARIIAFRKSLGMERKDFAPEINMSLSNLSKLERNLIKPSKGFLKAMMLYFGVSSEWLLTGEGEIYITAEEYISRGIELLGSEKMSLGLKNILKGPNFAKFQAMVLAGDIIKNDISDEIADYIQYIITTWSHGDEKTRNWLEMQLEIAFQGVKREL